MNPPQIRRRDTKRITSPWPVGVHPVLQRVYASRGVQAPEQVEYPLQRLLPPDTLKNIELAAGHLAGAIRHQESILVVGDYDCDGATATAVAVRGLRRLGAASVDFRVPSRFAHGYGLSPGLVEVIDPVPAWLITVDNGIAAHAGVAAARARGMRVIVTDHHLPGTGSLPEAEAIVNPNQPGDDFPSKSLAGVGVMFYLLLALRARMRAQGAFAAHPEPNLAELLDLVALGTVADMVPLDFNNRVLVEAGLRRIRAGRAVPGIRALIEISKRSAEFMRSTDLGFAVAPRINAAGRLQDMSLGITCLLSRDIHRAHEHALELERINRQRRELQSAMQAEAEDMLAAIGDNGATGVVLFDPGWHVGVIGLVASKIKERFHRPVVALARSADDSGCLNGSARSIPGFHIRDALAEVDARNPGLLQRFGGHAMAAGLVLHSDDRVRFTRIFDEVVRQRIEMTALQPVLWTDGELAEGECGLDLARQLRFAGPWGQGFPEPLFDNVFERCAWKVMAERHVRLDLRDPRDGSRQQAVIFNAYTGTPPPSRMRVAYTLGIDAWHGAEKPRLLVAQMAAV